jgi:hypothetical protein
LRLNVFGLDDAALLSVNAMRTDMCVVASTLPGRFAFGVGFFVENVNVTCV